MSSYKRSRNLLIYLQWCFIWNFSCKTLCCPVSETDKTPLKNQGCQATTYQNQGCPPAEPTNNTNIPHQPQPYYNLWPCLWVNNVTQYFKINEANKIMPKALTFPTDTTFTPIPDNNHYKYIMHTSVMFLINAIFNPDTGEIMTYKKWSKTLAKKM